MVFSCSYYTHHLLLLLYCHLYYVLWTKLPSTRLLVMLNSLSCCCNSSYEMSLPNFFKHLSTSSIAPLLWLWWCSSLSNLHVVTFLNIVVCDVCDVCDVAWQVMFCGLRFFNLLVTMTFVSSISLVVVTRISFFSIVADPSDDYLLIVIYWP